MTIKLLNVENNNQQSKYILKENGLYVLIENKEKIICAPIYVLNTIGDECLIAYIVRFKNQWFRKIEHTISIPACW